MCAVKSSRPIVEWIVIHFSKVITADDSEVFSKSTAKGEVIKRDPRVNHGNGLTSPVKTILSSQIGGSGSSVFKRN